MKPNEDDITIHDNKKQIKKLLRELVVQPLYESLKRNFLGSIHIKNQCQF